jgi:hypothetical protein
MKLLPARRGRPQKFGRPSRAVTLTLPEDVISALSGVDEDLSRAVVELALPLVADGVMHAPAELTKYGDSAVIVVKLIETLRMMPGVTLVPQPDGRALISLDESTTAYEFELRLRDRIDAGKNLDARERAVLMAISRILRAARQTKGPTVHQRSIIVLQSTRHRRTAGESLSILFSAIALTACTSGAAPTQPSTPAPVTPTLTAPAAEMPPDDQQLTRCSPSFGSPMARRLPQERGTSEFQVASAENFAANGVALSAQNAAEGLDAKTTWTVSTALSLSTRFAHIGAPFGTGGPSAASVPGMPAGNVRAVQQAWSDLTRRCASVAAH